MQAKNIILGAAAVICLLTLQIGAASAQEVNKGGIPAAQLEESYKTLDWGVAIWDNKEAIEKLKKSAKILWVDTRPASFVKKGTIHGSVELIYNKKGVEENTLSQESLGLALKDHGMDKSGPVVFFCQGPKCHRSYNATYVTVTEWGYEAKDIIWYRAGYPYLFKEVKENAKLKRKAKKYISEAGLTQL